MTFCERKTLTDVGLRKWNLDWNVFFLVYVKHHSALVKVGLFLKLQDVILWNLAPSGRNMLLWGNILHNVHMLCLSISYVVQMNLTDVRGLHPILLWQAPIVSWYTTMRFGTWHKPCNINVSDVVIKNLSVLQAFIVCIIYWVASESATSNSLSVNINWLAY